MNSDYVLIRRRRQLAFGALTVLLHLFVFDWFSGQLGRRPEKAALDARAPMQAQLVRTAARLAPEPVAAPKPTLDFPPLPSVPPEQVEVADPGAASASDTTAQADAAGAVDDDVTPLPAGLVRVMTGAADVQSHPGPASAGPAEAQAASPAAAPLPEPRSYKTVLPPPADITLDVARIDADGTHWNGEARLSWRRTGAGAVSGAGSGAGYRIDVEAGIRVAFARVSLLTLSSEGTLGDEGFVPILMTEKRRGRAMTATHFNRKEGTLTFSASQARVALVPGTQDKASLPLQLAAIGRGDPKQISGNIDILVGEDRGANVFSFTVAGQERIATRFGPVATWHLVRPPKPGSYHSRLEVWLAPEYGWLPVQLRSIEANGAITTQTASNIVIKETGSQ